MFIKINYLSFAHMQGDGDVIPNVKMAGTRKQLHLVYIRFLDQLKTDRKETETVLLDLTTQSTKDVSKQESEVKPQHLV